MSAFESCPLADNAISESKIDVIIVTLLSDLPNFRWLPVILVIVSVSVPMGGLSREPVRGSLGNCGQAERGKFHWVGRRTTCARCRDARPVNDIADKAEAHAWSATPGDWNRVRDGRSSNLLRPVRAPKETDRAFLRGRCSRFRWWWS